MHRPIIRQHQLAIAVSRALVVDVVLRHLDEPLVLAEAPLLHVDAAPAPVVDPVDVLLRLQDHPGVLGVVRQRRVDEGVVVVDEGVGPVEVRFRLEPTEAVVAAATLVQREGVLHAVVVQEVGGVVVEVVVLVAPEVPLQHLAGLDADAVGGAFAGGKVRPRDDVGHGGFAVAECGAQVVAVGAGDWSFADEAGRPFGC